MTSARYYFLRVGIVIVIICDTLNRILYRVRSIDDVSRIIEQHIDVDPERAICCLSHGTDR